MNSNIQYRVYKISVNLFSFRNYRYSKVYEIPKGKSTIIPGLKYSLITFLFGWFATPRGIGTTLRALHTNFTGGEDYTKLIVEDSYDKITAFIYNNLTRETQAETTLGDIDILIELQEEYTANNATMFDTKNANHLITHMSKLHIDLSAQLICEFFEALKNFKMVSGENNYD